MDGALTDVLRSLRAASGTVLAVHALKTAFALLLLGRFGLELSHAAQSGDLIAVVTSALQHAPRQSAVAQWIACAFALLGPLLVQLVLAALLGRPRAAAAAGSRYVRALALSIARFCAIAAAAGVALALSSALARSVAPQLETLARGLPLALGALAVAWLATAHDLACARVALDEVPSLRRAISHAARTRSLRAIALHAGLTVLGLSAYALGEAASRALVLPALSLAITQSLALATSFARAAWLAAGLAIMNRPVKAGLK